MAVGGDEVRASAAAMERTAAEIAAVADEFRRRLDAVDERVRGFLGGGWAGRSAAAFDDVFREWHSGTADVQQGLAVMARALSDNARAYRERDDGNAAGFEPTEELW
jgi:WXG100 family type VII secretion target